MSITTWLLYLTTLAVVSHGARIRVDVGSNGAPALVYTPKVISAQVGDIVDFHFVDENAASSVVRGVAGAPCTPFTPTKKGFFNSGFVLGDPTGVCVILLPSTPFISYVPSLAAIKRERKKTRD